MRSWRNERSDCGKVNTIFFVGALCRPGRAAFYVGGLHMDAFKREFAQTGKKEGDEDYGSSRQV